MGSLPYAMLLLFLSLTSWSFAKPLAGPFSANWNNVEKAVKAVRLAEALEQALPRTMRSMGSSRVPREVKEDEEDFAKEMDMALIGQEIRNLIIRDLTEPKAIKLNKIKDKQFFRRRLL